MADWGQLIAGIDGYRNYENNRALDLQNKGQFIQNQANNIRNQEMMTINGLKAQIANLSNNPYAKLNAWDPATRNQQLLNEDKQLKIASKWATSIKNMAPDKRAQGYAQFLRAMPGLGIDVSDMPRGYDEAFVNQMADLGIESETRYQNEQQNSRLERQIEAQREARQEEFNNQLAAFDYQRQAQLAERAEKDNYIKNLGLDEARTKLLLAKNRGIDLLETHKPLSPLEQMEKVANIAKNGGMELDPDKLNNGEIVYRNKTNNLTGDAYLFNKLVEDGKSVEEAIELVGKMSPERKFEFEKQLKQIDLSNNKEMADYNAQIAEDKAQNNYIRSLLTAQNNNELKKDFESYKTTLPTEEIIKAQQQANALKKAGVKNITAEDIIMEDYLNKLNERQLSQDKTRADIDNINSQIEERKTTPQIKNAEYLQANPDMAGLPVFNSGTNISVNNGGQNQSEFAKQMGRNMANNYLEIQKAGDDANAQLVTLNAMSEAINNPSVYQGTGGGMVNTFKTLLSSIGQDIDGMDDAAIINSGKSQLMGALRKDLMPGPMSDRDIVFLVNTVPDLGKTREQNKAILNLFTKAYQRQAQAAELVNDYVRENGSWDVNGQMALKQAFNTPMFTDAEKAAALGNGKAKGSAPESKEVINWTDL